MDKFSKLLGTIIAEQENIIGPIAIEQAKKVTGLNINWPEKKVIINGDKKTILESLINRYKNIFGQASVEVCREILHSMAADISKEQIPSILQ